MAAPVVRDKTAATATNSPTSPASTEVGDCVIVGHWTRGTTGVPTHTKQGAAGEYNEIRSHAHDDGSTDGRLSVAYKIATAAGANAYNAYTSSTGTDFAGIVVLQSGTFHPTLIGDVSNSVTQTTNAAPDPGAVSTPVADCLVAVFAAWHLGSAADVAVTPPTNYNEQWEIAGSATAEFSCATRSIAAASSENPGAFTDNVAPNGTASVTISFRPHPGLSGTSAGVATTSGAIVGKGSVSGTSAGTSSTTGDIVDGAEEEEQQGILEGSTAGTSSTSGTIVGVGSVSGSSAGIATTTASISGVGSIGGTSAGLASVTGSVTGNGALAGSSVGSATVSASVAGAGLVSGTTSGSATASASIASTGSMSGTTAGLATVSGTIGGVGELSGSALGSSTATASFEGEEEQDVGELTGSTSGTSTASASVVGIGSVAGAVSGTSATSGAIAALGQISGTASSTATVSGSIAGSGSLAGSTAGTSGVSASIQDETEHGGEQGLSGTTSGTSSATATITAIGTVRGIAAGLALAAGVLLGVGQVSGSAHGTSSATASIAAWEEPPLASPPEPDPGPAPSPEPQASIAVMTASVRDPTSWTVTVHNPTEIRTRALNARTRMALFYVGDPVDLDTKLSVNGEPRDPSALSLRIRRPDKTTIEYVYGTDLEITRLDTGYYVAHFTVTQAGRWNWTWVSPGPIAQGAKPGFFEVKPVVA